MKEEVIASLETKLSRRRCIDFRLGELRPTIQNTQAATLMVKLDDAEKIFRDGRFRVGIEFCSVEKNITMKKCYRKKEERIDKKGIGKKESKEVNEKRKKR